MNCNDFIISMRKEFGQFIYRATSADGKIYLKDWPTNPHDVANRQDSCFIVPIIEQKEVKIDKVHYKRQKQKPVYK